MSKIKCQMSIRFNFSVPPEFLRSFFRLQYLKTSNTMLLLENRSKLKYLGPFVESHQTLEERAATRNRRNRPTYLSYKIFITRSIYKQSTWVLALAACSTLLDQVSHLLPVYYIHNYLKHPRGRWVGVPPFLPRNIAKAT